MFSRDNGQCYYSDRNLEMSSTVKAMFEAPKATEALVLSRLPLLITPTKEYKISIGLRISELRPDKEPRPSPGYEDCDNTDGQIECGTIAAEKLGLLRNSIPLKVPLFLSNAEKDELPQRLYTECTLYGVPISRFLVKIDRETILGKGIVYVSGNLYRSTSHRPESLHWYPMYMRNK